MGRLQEWEIPATFPPLSAASSKRRPRTLYKAKSASPRVPRIRVGTCVLKDSIQFDCTLNQNDYINHKIWWNDMGTTVTKEILGLEELTSLRDGTTMKPHLHKHRPIFKTGSDRSHYWPTNSFFYFLIISPRLGCPQNTDR